MKCRRRSCSGYLRYCCSSRCPDYDKVTCPKLQGIPYVCNGCGERGSCRFEKMEYSPSLAQTRYREILSSSRAGHRATNEEIAVMDRVISRGSSKNQSLNHIYSYAGDRMPYSQRTAYNLVNDGVLPNVLRVDLPKAVTYRRRVNRNKAKTPCEQAYLAGRQLADYMVYIQENPSASVVQMDCVEGRKPGNGRVLLTLHFVSCSLQISFILDNKTMDSVSECHRSLRTMLGNELYSRLFEVILTDRGCEFKSPERIEMADNGELVSRVFYCDPLRSDQKAECKRNHGEIRRIFPKGSILTCDQSKVSGMMDNINSMARPQFLNRTAYEMFVLIYGQPAADALGLKRIDPSKVTLTPSLLK